MADLFRIGTDENLYRVEDFGIDGDTGDRKFHVEARRVRYSPLAVAAGAELFGPATFNLAELKAIHANLTDILSRYTDDGHRA